MRAIFFLLTLAFPLWSPAQQVWLGVGASGEVYAKHSGQSGPEDAIPALTTLLGRSGWLFASPLRLETRGDTAWVMFDVGPRVKVSEIDVQGDLSGDLARSVASLRNEPYSATALEERVSAYLERMQGQGFGSAEIQVVTFDVRRDSTLHLILLLERGARYVFGSLNPQRAGRTSRVTLQRLARWREGDVWVPGSEAEIQSRLQRSGLFLSVGQPEVAFTPEGVVNVEIPLQERSPGAFDLVLGLQPRPEVTAQWVGSGFIQLFSALGMGERASFRFERLPGTVSRVEATADWPRLPVVPIGLKAQFAGVQQDSLFARQSAGVEAFMEFDGLEWGLTLSSERIRPGLAGARMGSEGQRIARSDAVFRGVRMRWRFGRPAVQGTVQEGMDLYLAQGTRERVRQTVEAGWERSREMQYRIEGKLSFFSTLHTRWNLRAGLQGWMLRSERPEASELYRLGGAGTFRGFEEDQFLASHAARVFAEPGFRLDADARAFLFGEMGRVREPLAARRMRTTFAYGAGTAIALGAGGLIVTYALTPAESFRAGKIHLVLSLGF